MLPSLIPEQVNVLEIWLRSLLWEKTLPSPILHPKSDSRDLIFEIHRTKGLFVVAKASWRVVQGVRDVFEIQEIEHSSSPDDGNQNAGKIIFIGRGLDQNMFQRSLDYTLKE